MLDRIKKRWNIYENRYAPFLNRAENDLKFYRGEQWDTTIKDAREKAGKPALVKNRIKPKVNLIKGVQRQNRYFFKVIPTDSAEPEYAEISRGINAKLKEIENENDGEYELSECFQEGIQVGRGYLESFIKEDKSTLPAMKKILFKSRDHNRVFVDPDSVEYDLSDAKDYFICTSFSQESLIDLYPEKKEEIKKLTPNEDGEWIMMSGDDGVEHRDYPTQGKSDDSSGEDNKSKNYLLKEYYYYETVNTSYLVNSMGIFEPIEGDTKKTEKTQENIKKKALERGIEFDYKVLSISKKKWYVCTSVGELELDKQEMPIDEPHIAPYFPDRIRSIKDLDKRDLGIITDLKGCQEEYNMLSSQTLAHINSSVNSGIAAEEGALLDKEKWKKLGATPGFIGEIKKGFWGKWQKMFPEQLSQGHFTLGKDSAQEMDEISNIRPDLMGANQGDKSGRALALQQQQGFLGINFYFDNFRRTKHLLARKLVKLICWVEGYDFNKLKLVVDDTAESPTMRYANFLETKELFESGALDSPYGDLIIEGMNITNKDRYIERWNQISEFKQMAQQLQQKEQQLMQMQSKIESQAQHESPQAKAAAEQAAIQDVMGGQ